MTQLSGDNRTGRLADRIGAELRSASRVHRSGVHLAAFTEVREEVAEAPEAGFTVKAIWSQLHKEGAVRMAYETFRDYCRSAELRRRPLTRGHRVAEKTGETLAPTLEDESVPDGGPRLREVCVHCDRFLAGRLPAGEGVLRE